MNHKDLMEEAIKSADALFNNAFVSAEQTLHDLRDLQCHIDIKIDALKSQIKR